MHRKSVKMTEIGIRTPIKVGYFLTLLNFLNLVHKIATGLILCMIHKIRSLS